MFQNAREKYLIWMTHLYASLSVVFLLIVLFWFVGTDYEVGKEEKIINDMLNKSAQLIITSSIGISAIAFSLANENKFKNNLKKDELINSIILIVVLSFGLFLSQYINTPDPDTLMVKKWFMIVTVGFYLESLRSLLIDPPSKPKQIGTSKPIKEKKSILAKIFNK